MKNNKKSQSLGKSPEKTGLIHNDIDSAPQDGAFIVGQVEDTSLKELSPIKANDAQNPLLKRKHKKLKKGKIKKQVFISGKKLQKTTSWKKRLFNFAVVLVLGVATGAVLGGWYKRYTDSMFNASIYPSDITPYLDNTDAVLAASLNNPNLSEADKQNFVEILKSQGKTPQNLSPSQNYALATYKASMADTFHLISHGNVTTMGISQSVYSERAYNGETYELTSQSKGLLTIAICAVYKKDGNSVKLIQGKNVQDESADWTGESTNYTIQEFLDINGSLPSVLSPYIVSSKTIKKENDIQIETTTIDGKTVYAFKMNLDPGPAAAQYYKQVKLTSGLGDYPLFKQISITAYIDENWNFVRTYVEEGYTVKYGVAASCSGTLTVDYTFNQPVKLPY